MAFAILIVFALVSHLTLHIMVYIDSDFSTVHIVPSITEGIRDMTVTIGEQANFFCSVLLGHSSEVVDIKWIVDGTVYERCPAESITDICFENSYMNDTRTIRSTLIITDSSSLDVGSHTVECAVYSAVQGNQFGSSTTFLHVEAIASEFHSLSLGSALSMWEWH